jgi:hypothetical protein
MAIYSLSLSLSLSLSPTCTSDQASARKKCALCVQWLIFSGKIHTLTQFTGKKLKKYVFLTRNSQKYFHKEN